MAEDEPPDLQSFRRNIRDNSDVLVMLAKLEAMGTLQAARMEARAEAIESMVESTTATLERKLDGVNKRLDTQNGRVGKGEDRLDKVETTLRDQVVVNARKDGIAEGRSQTILTKGQLTIIGTLFTIASTAGGLIVALSR